MKKNKKQKISFTVNRKRWGTATMNGESYGLDGRESKMCCLGHLRVALKIKNQQKAQTPRSCQSSKWPKSLSVKDDGDDYYTNTELCKAIMEVNDDNNFTEKDREKELTRLFKQGGIEVKFVG